MLLMGALPATVCVVDVDVKDENISIEGMDVRARFEVTVRSWEMLDGIDLLKRHQKRR